ncbi:MAG: glycoside hydrolase family 36 protein [Candidatus Cryptobacteroides sp.]
MKRPAAHCISLLAVSMLLALLPCSAPARAVVGMSGDKVGITSWIEARFSKGDSVPFSFKLDGVPSSEFLGTWKRERRVTVPDDPSAVSRSYIWSSERKGLAVICDVTGYPESNVVEWVLHFRNISGKDSGRISDVKTADFRMDFPSAGPLSLHYAEGNKISRADYSPRTLDFREGESVRFEPSGGRSSSEAFPFYNIESRASGQGVMMSIGWTGTWFSSFRQAGRKALDVEAGMVNLDLYLKPDEEIRVPSVAFLFWSGKQMDGQNRFRRFLLEHRYRKINGEAVRNYLCSGFNYRDPQPFGEYSCITCEWAVAMINRYRQFGLVPDVFWLDAGWHTGASDYENGQNWASTTGNWTVDSKRFPDGMKPVSDAAHAAGARFMLWFEPERVVKGTLWAVEHKEWMLDCPQPDGSEESSWLLFDLGNDEACDWLCKYYGDFLEENGVDWYRQDCNIQPAKYWAFNDEPGRKGMKEIRHIENLYRFWDYLLERFPGMVIDNCASGGKRLDWETIGRSVPLWRSDYYHYDDPDGYQCHTYGLNYFLPVHGTGILLPDKYSFRSSLSSTLIYNWKITEKGLSVLEMRERLAEYRSISDYYFEDYYPLTGDGDLTGHDIWLAYQMHRPSDGSGILVAFRRKESEDGHCLVSVQGLSPGKLYRLTDSDTGTVWTKTGKELSEGFLLVLDKPGSSLLIKYEEL